MIYKKLYRFLFLNKKSNTVFQSKNNKIFLIFSNNKKSQKFWEVTNHKYINKFFKLFTIASHSMTHLTAYEKLRFKTAIPITSATIVKNIFQKFNICINNLRCQIIKESINILLEQIFEPNFLLTTHHFHIFKSQYNIINKIKNSWINIDWFLKCNIYKDCIKLNKYNLINIIYKKINDREFLSLLKNWLKTIKWNSENFKMSIHYTLFLLFSNIYLQKLDYEINKKIKINNKKYTFISKNNLNEIKIYYIRYNYSLLLAAKGPKSLILLAKKKLMNFIYKYLKLKWLKENNKKTFTIYISSNKISFLKMYVCCSLYYKLYQKSRLQIKKLQKNIFSQSNHNWNSLSKYYCTMNISLKAILNKLKYQGLFSKLKKFIIFHKFMTQSNKIIIYRFYKLSLIFFNYYFCCSNFYKIKNFINYFIRWSTIHTLAKYSD